MGTAKAGTEEAIPYLFRPSIAGTYEITIGITNSLSSGVTGSLVLSADEQFYNYQYSDGVAMTPDSPVNVVKLDGTEIEVDFLITNSSTDENGDALDVEYTITIVKL